MKIDVTENDIKGSERSSPCGCPVARAIRRQTIWMPLVATQHIRFGCNIVPLPGDVSMRIGVYDKTGKMDPFSFELEIPDP
jgi:hypothetical protein